MSARRLARALFGLLCLIVFLRLADSGYGASPSITTVTLDGNTINVQTRIEISGEAATPELAQLIEDYINGVWQDPSNRHTYCGFDVSFDAEVQVQQGEGSTGWHHVEVVTDRFSSGFDWARPRDVYSGDVSGQFAAGARVASRNDLHFAYLAGALFGAPSEFSSDENGRRTPNPGREGTLTSASVTRAQSSIDEQIVENIMESASQALPPGSLPECETWVGEVTVLGQGTSSCYPAPIPGCSSTATLASIPETEDHFRLLLDRDGKVIGGAARLRTEFTSIGSLVTPFCSASWHYGAKAEFTGQAEPTVGPTVQFLGEVKIDEAFSMSGNCPGSPGATSPYQGADKLVLEDIDIHTGAGICRLSSFEELSTRAPFSYTCTYTIRPAP